MERYAAEALCHLFYYYPSGPFCSLLFSSRSVSGNCFVLGPLSSIYQVPGQTQSEHVQTRQQSLEVCWLPRAPRRSLHYKRVIWSTVLTTTAIVIRSLRQFHAIQILRPARQLMTAPRVSTGKAGREHLEWKLELTLMMLLTVMIARALYQPVNPGPSAGAFTLPNAYFD